MQSAKSCGKIRTRDGFLLCPKCGRRTDQKILPNTEARNLPLYCKKCKQSTIVDIESLCHSA